MNSELNFNSRFIQEFTPDSMAGATESTIVYHYTSPEAFLSIVQGKSVRFSDLRYMNDKSESFFFVKRILKFCDENKEKYQHFIDVVNELLKENDYNKIKRLEIQDIRYKDFLGLRMEKQRNFIFCTSNDSDSLNMWNYYASNGKYTGYNIGFSVPKFLKTFDVDHDGTVDSFIIYYGNVLYKKKLQFEAIEELAKAVESFITKKPDKQSVQRAAISVRSYIELRGPFFKDESFRSENEFRFLFSIAEKRIPHNEDEAKKYFGQYNQRLKEGFCVKNGLVVPFMQVAIPEYSISRITMAPMTEYEIAKSSIKELLNVKGLRGTNDTEIPIFKSKIPIRF